MSEAVITSSDLFRDINATFLSTYRDTVGRHPRLADAMRLGISSSKRTERFGYFESPPTIERIDRGEAIVEDAFRAIAYSVENLTWGKAIGFHEEDIEDIQLGDIREVARRLAIRAAQLPEQVFFQILQGTADASLLKAIPTAPDGAALYATTAGGSARFGVTNGNLLTGSGVATAGAVRSDFWSAIEQAKQFQDTEGEPLLNEGDIDQGVTILYGVQNEEVMREAFLQGRTAQIVAGTSTSNTGGVGSVSNTILESGMSINLWGTQRITGDDIHVFFQGVEPKPVFETMRRAPRMIDETRENSERARRYRILATLLDMRCGYGVNAAYGTVKINN
jgi:hypothetical protein